MKLSNNICVGFTVKPDIITNISPTHNVFSRKTELEMQGENIPETPFEGVAYSIFYLTRRKKQKTDVELLKSDTEQ